MKTTEIRRSMVNILTELDDGIPRWLGRIHKMSFAATPECGVALKCSKLTEQLLKCVQMILSAKGDELPLGELLRIDKSNLGEVVRKLKEKLPGSSYCHEVEKSNLSLLFDNMDLVVRLRNRLCHGQVKGSQDGMLDDMMDLVNLVRGLSQSWLIAKLLED